MTKPQKKRVCRGPT